MLTLGQYSRLVGLIDFFSPLNVMTSLLGQIHEIILETVKV